MTTSPPSETGPSAEKLPKEWPACPGCEEKELFCAAIHMPSFKHTVDCLLSCYVCATRISYRSLLAVQLEAKRSAHLEDARAVCHWCSHGNPARSEPIYTDQPRPVRWFHRFPNQADDQCIAGPVWDALSLPPGGQK